MIGQNNIQAYKPNHSNGKTGSYGYATNNPIRNIDYSGCASFTDPGYQKGMDGINLPGATCFKKTKWWNPFTWFSRCD